MTEGHHDISHKGTPESFTNIRAIHKHLWTQTTQLYDDAQGLAGGGRLGLGQHAGRALERARPGRQSHDSRQLVIFAGGAGGYFRRGRYIDFNNTRSFSDMLLSCFHYMGFENETLFGDKRLASDTGGPLPGLT